MKRARGLLLLALSFSITLIATSSFLMPQTSAVQPVSDNCGFLLFSPTEPTGYQHTTAADCSQATPETFSYPIPTTPALTITASGGRFAYWAGWAYGTTTYNGQNIPCGAQTITVSFSRPVLSLHLQPSGGAGPSYGSNSITITDNIGDSTVTQKAPADYNFPPVALTAPFPGPGISSITLTAADGLAFQLGSVGFLLPENDCYPVKNLEMIAVNSPLDTNPNVGGGQRLFPDKLTSADTVDRKRVRIKAYTASGANKTIFFRSFDLDDPSSAVSPVDSNDTGGPTGDDNRGIPRLGNIVFGGWDWHV